MTTVHLVRGSRSIAQVTVERAPKDGLQASDKVNLTTSQRTERELIYAALVRQVDECGPNDEVIAIELGANDN